MPERPSSKVTKGLVHLTGREQQYMVPLLPVLMVDGVPQPSQRKAVAALKWMEVARYISC